MQLINGLLKIQKKLEANCVCLGNFDGLHLGHQELVRKTIEGARDRHLSANVLSFDPPPEAFFNHKLSPRLFTQDQKLRAFAESGIHSVIVEHFDKEFSEFSAERFMRDYLIKLLNADSIFVGYDFRFGKNRAGDTAQLRSFFREINHSVTVCEPVRGEDGEAISSTRIRKLLSEGQVKTASQYLGRPYLIEATVRKDKGLARSFGFPTLNMPELLQYLPKFGVYVGYLALSDRPLLNLPRELLPAIANLGCRPSIEGGDRRTVLEVHALNQNLDADYSDKQLGFYFLDFVRDEAKFESLEDLRVQISKDIAAANHYFR